MADGQTRGTVLQLLALILLPLEETARNTHMCTWCCASQAQSPRQREIFSDLHHFYHWRLSLYYRWEKQDFKMKHSANTEAKKLRLSSALDVITPCTFYQVLSIFNNSIILFLFNNSKFNNSTAPYSKPMNSPLDLQQLLKTEGKIIYYLIKQETQQKGVSVLCPFGEAELHLSHFLTWVYSSSALYSQACLTFSFSLATSMICSNEALSSLVCFAKKLSKLGSASLSSFSASPNKRRKKAWERLIPPFL